MISLVIIMEKLILIQLLKAILDNAMPFKDGMRKTQINKKLIVKQIMIKLKIQIQRNIKRCYNVKRKTL